LPGPLPLRQTQPVSHTSTHPASAADSSQPRRREQRAWAWYDWAASAFSTTVLTVFLGPYLTGIAESAAAEGQQITLLGIIPVTAASYFPYLVSLSVAVQVLSMPIVGAMSDIARSRKAVMGVCAYIGAGAVVAMWLLEGDRYQLGGVLFVIANVAFGAAIVVYNAFLPEIAAPGERDGLSSRAWALGYAGGVVLLIVNLALFLGHASVGVSEADAVRLSLASAGLWWAIFTLVPLRGLRNRPPAQRPAGGLLTGGFRQLGRTARELRRYPQALLFLLAFLLYNDGIQTVIALAATFAVEELGLATLDVITAVLLVQVVGIAGALLLGRAASRFGAKRVVLASLLAWSAVLLAAFLLPAGNQTAFYLLAAGIGFVLGGSQALSRSLFAQLVPRDREGEYFALYEVSGGASAALGPLLFALTLQFADSYRLAILFLVVFFVAGGALLARLDVARGMADVATPSEVP